MLAPNTENDDAAIGNFQTVADLSAGQLGQVGHSILLHSSTTTTSTTTTSTSTSTSTSADQHRQHQ